MATAAAALFIVSRRDPFHIQILQIQAALRERDNPRECINIAHYSNAPSRLGKNNFNIDNANANTAIAIHDSVLFVQRCYCFRLLKAANLLMIRRLAVRRTYIIILFLGYIYIVKIL